MKFTVKVAGIFAVVAFALTAVTANAAFTRDLTLGSTGADVIELQTWLEGKGFLTIPTGVSKGYFGAMTQSALAKYQASVGITPAAGYFGPITRAKVAMDGGSTTGGNTGSGSSSDLEGGDGDFKDFDIMGQPSNEDVQEGEEVEVFGFEFDADDSDLLVERVDFTLEGNGAEKPWKYIDEIKLMNGGDEVASIDASDSDTWDETSTDDQYEATISDIDTKVEEGETAEFTIAVVAKDGIDDGDLPIVWTIALSDDGVRAVNAEGINVYKGDSADEETFTLETQDAGNLDITVKSSDNEDQTVEVDEDNDTDDVFAYMAELEANDSDVNIEEVTVTLATTTGTVGEMDDMVKTVYLFIDGDEVGSESVSSASIGTAAIIFDDLDVDISEDDTVEMEVRVDLNEQDGNYEDGDGFYVSSTTIDYVDALDDDYTVSEGQDGGDLTLRVAGVMVELNGDPSYSRVFTADDAGEKDRVEYTIKFDISAFGDEDVYIDKSIQNTSSPSAQGAGVAWATTTDSTGTTTTSSSIFSASGDTSDDTGSHFLIEEGETRTFTLKITLEAGQDGASGIILTGINYDTDSTIDEYYTIDLDDFKVDPVSLNII